MKRIVRLALIAAALAAAAVLYGGWRDAREAAEARARTEAHRGGQV